MRCIRDMNIGDNFLIGNTTFIVLDQTDSNTFVISKSAMARKQPFGSSTDYKTSNLRYLCEKQILAEIEKYISSDDILKKECDLTTVDMQKDFGTLLCSVRVPTFDEARKYNDLLVNPKMGEGFWTCTSWSVPRRKAPDICAYIHCTGDITYGDTYWDLAIRPCFWLKNTTMISKEG